MYWNPIHCLHPVHQFRLIETWDVLKSHCPDFYQHPVQWLIETWDVLKSKTMADMEVATKINRNMRCIEMELNTPELPQDETINRNMRCIEIRNGSGRAESGNMINRNMRCIEIRRWALPWCCQRRLIETWDVLKYTVLLPDLIQRERLIETWDVLKFFRGLDKAQKTKD